MSILNKGPEYFEPLAKKLTAKWLETGKLPHKEGIYTYSKVGCMYLWSENRRFTNFYYGNDWNGSSSADDTYGTLYGPDIEFREAIKDLWDMMSFDDKTAFMAKVLGSEKD